MKWLPKWIGKVYCKIWAEFGETLFYFEDIQKLCGKYTPNYLSELKKAQVLSIFGKRARKKVYRLVPPDCYVFSLANDIDLKWLKQGIYTNLILKLFMVLKEKFTLNIHSFGIFGSVARNCAKRESDLDIIIIFKDIEGTISQRLDLLSTVEDSGTIRQEIEFLRAQSQFPRISYYPRNEAELRLNFFTIDIAFDLKILFDIGILSKFLLAIQKKIEERGIQRKYLDNEKYYLDLNLKSGEVFEFE